VDDIEASVASLLSEELDYDWKFPLFALLCKMAESDQQCVCVSTFYFTLWFRGRLL